MKSCPLHPGKSSRTGFFSTLKWKLIFTSVLCTAAVSLFGSLFLYYKMNTMLQQKADRIDDLHLSTLSDQLNEYLEDLSDLGNLCANDAQMVTALEQTDRSSYAMRQALDAQNRLNAYLASSPLSSTVDQLTVFNTDGRFISGAGRTMGTPQDYDRIIQQPLYRKIMRMQNPPAAMIAPAHSIHMAMRRDPYVLAIVCPVRGLGSTCGYGYLYAELGLDLFCDVLEPFDEWSKLFLATDDTVLICPESLTEEEMPTARQLAMEKIRTLHPDIVICDIAMPGMTGTELLQQAAKEFPHVVFIMLTNHPDFQLAQHSLRYRAVDYLLKSDLEPEALERSLAAAQAECRTRAKLNRVEMVDDYLEHNRQNMLEKARQYVLDNVDKRIMLQDVADHICISPGYLSALFKKQYDQTLVEFINEQKCCRASELIRQGQYRIYEISYMLGFENAYYFTRVFKRYLGMTPTEYQKKYTTEKE